MSRGIVCGSTRPNALAVANGAKGSAIEAVLEGIAAQEVFAVTQMPGLTLKGHALIRQTREPFDDCLPPEGCGTGRDDVSSPQGPLGGDAVMNQDELTRSERGSHTVAPHTHQPTEEPSHVALTFSLRPRPSETCC